MRDQRMDYLRARVLERSPDWHGAYIWWADIRTPGGEILVRSGASDPKRVVIHLDDTLEICPADVPSSVILSLKPCDWHLARISFRAYASHNGTVFEVTGDAE